MAINLQETLDSIKKDFLTMVAMVKDRETYEEVRVRFLGRKSQLNALLKQLKELPMQERKALGAAANQVRKDIEQKLAELQLTVDAADNRNKDWIDVTAPGIKTARGMLNILSQTQREIEQIFTMMGFEIADGPDVDDEWHNFDALNMPADHPARDMQDTFWLKQKIRNKEQKKDLRLLPRTQTSNVQIRYMETHKPPFRIIVPGRVFRNESTDARHENTFYQFEALVVDKDITVANFKSIAKTFFDAFFQRDLEVRLRPSYFPFTEPSFEFDVSCICQGRGCPICKGSGWIEIGGAGMVNQRVFVSSGYKRNEYQGFAWGFGIERLAMLKYKIDEIRIFKSGDLRFVRQF
jgi:phenylalanyl-tRNA synthetase alpha chain